MKRRCRLMAVRVAMATVVFLMTGPATTHAQSSYTFTTFAGVGPGAIDGTGGAARFNRPSGLAVDGARNVYVADSNNHTIRKITPTGVVTTLAGLADVPGSADGLGSAARFNSPQGIAVDTLGMVYVADYFNNTVRAITPAGVVTTLAGHAGSEVSSVDGTGSSASFAYPAAIAVDAAAIIYVADTHSNLIRKVTPTGVVTTLTRAGEFGDLAGLAIDATGTLYVADMQSSTIHKVTKTGLVSTIAGLAGTTGSEDGLGSAARFNRPSGVAVAADGTVYVADSYNRTIRAIATSGMVTTFAGLALSAGSADGTGSGARFLFPSGIAAGADAVYVADSDNNTIRAITLHAEVTTLAGTASFGGSDGIGTAARFYYPRGVAVDDAGVVYVADTMNRTIRRVTPEGMVTTLAGLREAAGSGDGTGTEARFGSPEAVAVDCAGTLYVADSANHTIRKVTPAGVVTTLAGLAGVSGGADGAGSSARFNHPSGIAADVSGNVYVADTWNHTIRVITPAGVVTTLAGDTGRFGSGDGTGSAARFDTPRGVAVDAASIVYVADTWNNSIRKITPAGVVTTMAGSGEFGSVDGTGGAARFSLPIGIGVDASGNVYVAGNLNETVRKITPAAVVTTLAGLPLTRGSADGTSDEARFAGMHGLAVTGDGTVLVADTFNNTIRKGVPAVDVPPVITVQPVSQTVHVGKAIEFAVVAKGPPAPTYRWEWSRDGWSFWATVAEAPIIHPEQPIYQGSSTATLRIARVTGLVHGVRYRAIATNAAGWVASQPVTLTVTDTLLVTTNGTGLGTVTSNPAAILCGSDCVEEALYGSSFTLTATPARNSSFAGWSGACTGMGSCSVTMTATRTVTATFLARPEAVSDAYSASVNRTLVVSGPGVLANDNSHGGGGLTAMLVSAPANGAVTLASDGGFIYVPNAGYVGPDTFAYVAINGVGLSEPAAVTIAIEPIFTPQKPLDLYVSSIVGSTITLRWIVPPMGPEPTGYELEGGTSPGTVMAALGTGSPFPIFTLTAPSAVLYLRVRALAGDDRSEPSNEVRVVVNVPEAPSAPAGLAAVVQGSAVALSWRNTFAGGAPVAHLLEVSGAAAGSFPFAMADHVSFAGVPPGTYRIGLRAVNGAGASPASNVITISVPQTCSGAPLPPTDFLVYKAGEALSAVWDPAGSGPASTGYIVNVTQPFGISIPTPDRAISGVVPPGVYALSVQATNACGTSLPTSPQIIVVP